LTTSDRRSTQEECKNKHVTSRRFTNSVTPLLRAWQTSCEAKNNSYMLAEFAAA